MHTHSATRLSYEDYLMFPDDGQRHELINGEHYVTPTPVTKHQRVVMRLVVALATYFETHPIGEVFVSPLTVRLSDHDVVEPDVMVVLHHQKDIVTERYLVGAPAIVIEVLSPSTRARDAGLKALLYQRAGVQEYWIVDPEADVVTLRGRTEGPEGRRDQSTASKIPRGGGRPVPLIRCGDARLE